LAVAASMQKELFVDTEYEKGGVEWVLGYLFSVFSLEDWKIERLNDWKISYWSNSSAWKFLEFLRTVSYLSSICLSSQLNFLL
jgi:hypothetical protein